MRKRIASLSPPSSIRPCRCFLAAPAVWCDPTADLPLIAASTSSLGT